MLEYQVIKIVQRKEGAVYKTAVVCTIWLSCDERTRDQENEIAKEHGGDFLTATGNAKF